MNKTDKLSLVCFTLSVISFVMVVSFLLVTILSPKVVEVNLVNANADLAGGKTAWQFKVKDRDVPAGESVRFFLNNFDIKVIEFKSQKVVDRLNIGSLIKNGDLVTYAYYGSGSSQGESLYIHIQHKDGTFREIKVNIDI